MNRDDAEEYTNALGLIAEGAYRKVALGIRLGIPKALGMKRDEWVARIGTIKMSIAERQNAVRELTADGFNNCQIADVLGVDESTVREDKRSGNSDSALERARQSRDKEDPVSGNSEPTKASRRAQREAELAAKQRALPAIQYGVIYADPPWRFEPYSRETGMDRAADNHYPTMPLEQIKALQVPAADDCVLFLWATAPMLPEAIEVMRAWGFEYRSRCIWYKHRIGTGYWFRDDAEELLVGVRGNIPAPERGTQYPAVISARQTQHSAKPFAFREMIEEMFPNLPKIELFAREKFEGWDCWGNEAA